MFIVFESIFLARCIIAENFFTGYDHVGLSSVATSLGVTVDSTLPVLGRLWLTTPTGYASSNLSELRPQWDLVYDQESGLEALYWGLGSAQGRTDLISWSRINIGDTSVSIPNSLALTDGQPVVLSLKVNKYYKVQYCRVQWNLYTIGTSKIVHYREGVLWSGVYYALCRLCWGIR